MASRITTAAPEAWDMVADHVRMRREALGLTAAELVKRSGGTPSLAVLSKIENGRGDRYTSRTLRLLCNALGWTPDSIDRVLAGREPILAEQTQPVLHSIDDPIIRAKINDLERRLSALEERERQRQAPETTPAAERHRAKRAAARPS